MTMQLDRLTIKQLLCTHGHLHCRITNLFSHYFIGFVMRITVGILVEKQLKSS